MHFSVFFSKYRERGRLKFHVPNPDTISAKTKESVLSYLDSGLIEDAADSLDDSLDRVAVVVLWRCGRRGGRENLIQHRFSSTSQLQGGPSSLRISYKAGNCDAPTEQHVS